jgi:hypothetical protein
MLSSCCTCTKLHSQEAKTEAAAKKLQKLTACSKKTHHIHVDT